MDPTALLPPPPPSRRSEGKEATLAGALQTQLNLAVAIQERLTNPSEHLEAREYRDLVSAASGIVALAHRSDEALRTISTYERVFSVVFEFLRRRGDQIGEDLVEELRGVARDLHAESDLGAAQKWFREGQDTPGPG